MDLFNSFSFELPTRIEYGVDSLTKLGEICVSLGIRRPVVITDRGIMNTDIPDRVEGILGKSDVESVFFDGIEPNPKDRNVMEGARISADFKADGLIALGGGSVIDAAKSIGVVLTNGGDIKEYQGKGKVKNPVPPLVTVPTTAGTGSEITFSSVITDTERNFKFTVKSPLIAAKVALVDPGLTVSMPPSVTASTGVDALTHAVEAYSATCHEPISDALALHAVSLIHKYIKRTVENGSDMEAREGMMMGSLLAGLAFSHSDVASVHCIAEALGGMYDLPHGVCNSVMLPYVMEYNMPYARHRYDDIARAMGFSGDNAAAMAVDWIKNLNREIGIPEFKDLGIRMEDLEIIAEKSAINISTDSNPRPMEKEDYLMVLNMALK